MNGWSWPRDKAAYNLVLPRSSPSHPSMTATRSLPRKVSSQLSPSRKDQRKKRKDPQTTTHPTKIWKKTTEPPTRKSVVELRSLKLKIKLKFNINSTTISSTEV